MHVGLQECSDKRQAGDGRGWERLHRDVKIPFTVSYFSSSIRLKMEVENNRSLGQIDFKSLTKGSFLSGFEARFYVQPVIGTPLPAIPCSLGHSPPA